MHIGWLSNVQNYPSLKTFRAWLIMLGINSLDHQTINYGHANTNFPRIICNSQVEDYVVPQLHKNAFLILSLPVFTAAGVIHHPHLVSNSAGKC